MDTRNDPRLRLVVSTILANAKYKSFYVVGSYARGEQRSDSDIDVLLIMKSPIVIPRFVGLRPVYALRKYQLGGTFWGAYSLRGVGRGGSSSLLPLLCSWRKDAVLVAGKDLLPTPNPRIDSSSFAVYASRVIHWFLYKLKLTRSGLGFEDHGPQWIAKEAERAIRDSMVISGVPASWGRVWSEVKAEAQGAEHDPRKMCELLAITLESIRPLMRFSKLHQLLYVILDLAMSGRIRWRTLLERVPIQFRFVEAMVLLLKGVSEEEPNARLIDGAARLVQDHTDFCHIGDPFQKWEKVRNTVCGNFEAVMMLGFEDAL